MLCSKAGKRYFSRIETTFHINTLTSKDVNYLSYYDTTIQKRNHFYHMQLEDHTINWGK